MRTVTKYYSDIGGAEFEHDFDCRAFEANLQDLNRYIEAHLKEGGRFCTMDAVKSIYAKFLGRIKNLTSDMEEIFFNTVVDFFREHEKDIKKYTDKLQYVEATYSSSHDCHDEHEYYAFPENYTRDDIMDYLQETAQAWYDGMGYGEDEDDYVEDEGPDYSYEVHPLEEVMKYGNFTEYLIA